MQALQVQRNRKEAEASKASLQREAQKPEIGSRIAFNDAKEVARLRTSLVLTAQRPLAVL